MQFAVAVATKHDALLKFFHGLLKRHVGNQPMNFFVLGGADYVVEVQGGWVVFSAFRACQGSFERRPLSAVDFFSGCCPVYIGLFVSLIVPSLVLSIVLWIFVSVPGLPSPFLLGCFVDLWGLVFYKFLKYFVSFLFLQSFLTQ